MSCVQLTTTFEVSNESIIEKFRYRTDSAGVNQSHGLVAALSLYKDPAMLSRLGFPVRSFTATQRDQSLRRLELVFLLSLNKLVANIL